MKKLLITVSLTVYSCFLFAQANTENNTDRDTARAKWGKIRIVDGTVMLSSNDIMENITLSKEYTVLVNAIEDAGLTETFKSKGPVTLFAPANSAFEKLPAGQLDSLLKPAHRYDLSYLLTYHAVAGRLSAKDIFKKISSGNGTATFVTLAGIKLTAKINANRNIVLVDENGGESVISKFDIQQSNGMLHVINAVLVPKQKPI